jgi:hypothetical protein
MRLKKKSIFLIFLTITMFSGIFMTNTLAKPNFIEMCKTSNQSYLDVKVPDYYSLGVIKAQYRGQQIITFDYALKGLIHTLGVPLDYCYYLANLYNNHILDDYKNEIRGIADTLPNLSYYDIVLQICLFDGFYGQIIPSKTDLKIAPIHLGGCTVVASKNVDGTITIGQNMDLSYYFKDTIYFMKYKLKGKQPVFAMYMGACHLVGTTKKVSTFLNLIETVVHGEISMPTSIKRRLSLETSKNAYEYQETMINNGFASSWNWLVGDKYNNLIACESIPAAFNEQFLNYGEAIVKSNTYKTLGYIQYLLNPSYSLERQVKAEELTLNAMSDGILTLDELLGNILSFRDGTDSSITRMPIDNPNDPIITSTIAFMGIKGKDGRFGVGNPLDNSWGVIPL